MKLFTLLLASLFLSGCGAIWPGGPGLLTPEVIKELREDKASVCFVTQGGPVAVASGIIALCRANSDGHSTLEVTPEGNLKVDHNIVKSN